MVLLWLRLISIRCLVCFFGLVSSLVFSVLFFFMVVFCGCVLVMGCMVILLFWRWIRILGEEFIICILLVFRKYMYGEGLSVCSVWYIFIGCVLNGMFRCWFSIIWKMLLVWMYFLDLLIVVMKLLWVKLDMKLFLLSMLWVIGVG